MTIYTSLTEEQKNFHVTGMLSSGDINGEFVFFPISGILPSGEGNFYDPEQIPKTRKFTGYDDYSFTVQQGSDPLTYNLPPPIFTIPTIGISGLKPYSSGDVAIRYTHNSPDPSGGTGLLDKLPYNASFDPNDFLVKNSG